MYFLQDIFPAPLVIIMTIIYWTFALFQTVNYIVYVQYLHIILYRCQCHPFEDLETDLEMLVTCSNWQSCGLNQSWWHQGLCTSLLCYTTTWCLLANTEHAHHLGSNPSSVWTRHVTFPYWTFVSSAIKQGPHLPCWFGVKITFWLHMWRCLDFKRLSLNVDGRGDARATTHRKYCFSPVLGDDSFSGSLHRAIIGL